MWTRCFVYYGHLNIRSKSTNILVVDLPILIVSLPRDVSDDLNFLDRRNLYLGSMCLVTFIKIWNRINIHRLIVRVFVCTSLVFRKVMHLCRFSIDPINQRQRTTIITYWKWKISFFFRYVLDANFASKQNSYARIVHAYTLPNYISAKRSL